MRSRKQLPDQVFGLIAMSIGAAIVLLYLGVIPYTPDTDTDAAFSDPRHWQILCFGLSFFCAGAAFLLAKTQLRWLQAINSLTFIAAFFSVMIWMLYFSGKAPLPMQIIGSVALAFAALGVALGQLAWLKAGRQKP